MTEPMHDIAEAVVNNQIAELDDDVATLESVTSKSDGLLHIELDYKEGYDAALDPQGEGPVAKAIGIFTGILTDSPELYDRAALDLYIHSGVRIRFELPGEWFLAHLAGDMSVEEVDGRVWDTIHAVDPEGTPRALEDLPEIAAELDAGEWDGDALPGK